MKKILLFILIFCLIPFASATLEVSPNVSYQTSTANFTFSQNNTYDSIGFNDPNLILTTNGREIALSSDRNISIKSISSSVDDVSVVINGSSANVIITAALDKANTYYRYIVNTIDETPILSDASGIITKSVITTGETTYRFFYSITTTVALVSNCNSNSSFWGSLLPIFGIGLMIFAFGFVILQIKGAQNGNEVNPTAIVSGIIVGVVGFGMLLIGNYLIYAIMGVTSC